METYTTFSTQIELIPRLTIVYGFGENVKVTTDSGQTEIVKNGFAIEWLWFGIFIEV